MVKIDRQAFAKDEFFHGEYKDIPFTITELRDLESGAVDRVVSWFDIIPINKEEVESQIIEHFEKN